MHSFPNPITALYAGVLGILLVVISARVSVLRAKFKVMFGDGGQEALMRAIRAQGNFIEYVPLALLLIIMVEWAGAKPWVVHSLAGGLLASRLIHYWGITARKDPGRGIGVTITWIVLAVAGLVVLYQRWVA
jgi:uncharacterized membrane protein YecN with MAPEG domain